MVCIVRDRFKPAAALIGIRIKGRHIGLDIQERRAIENVHILDRERAPVNTGEPDNREADRVGAFWRPGRKNAAGHRIEKWRNLQGIS